MDNEQFLQGIAILADLSREDIGLLVEHAQSLTVPRGTRCVKMGDMGRYLWFIRSGEAEVTIMTEDG
ncbi:MAG: cyclic nucleotide-binding domain-containing protein, partial [Syntrophales bacterium]|nr:cyclic nucleotide-binding domain-containing protein [Syntrophales bacterium]